MHIRTVLCMTDAAILHAMRNITPEERVVRLAIAEWYRKGMAEWGGSAAKWIAKTPHSSSNITRFIRSPETASMPRLDLLRDYAKHIKTPLPAEVINMITRGGDGDNHKPYDSLSHAEDSDTPPPTVSIIEVDHEHVAQSGAEMASILAEWEVPAAWLLTIVGVKLDDHLRVITIEDDRMAGTLDVGDKVLVHVGDIDPYQSGVYLTRDGKRLSARRLQDANRRTGKVLVISDNPRYQSRELEIDALEIVGRVIARWHPVR
jgi:hypothetical protein